MMQTRSHYRIVKASIRTYMKSGPGDNFEGQNYSRRRQVVVVRSSLSGRRRQAVVVRPSSSGRRRQAVVFRPLSSSRRSQACQAISIVFRRQIKFQAMNFSTEGVCIS